MATRSAVFGWMAVTILAVCRSAGALPATLQISDTDDHTTITLRVLAQTIIGDVNTWCSARIVVQGMDESEVGDHIDLWVYEDDTAGDDLLYHTSFNVTSGDISANRIDRTFDCSGNFGDDIGDEAEYYIEAHVETNGCTWCFDDTPETGVIDVLEVNDDGAEPDDTSGTAKPLGLGTTSNRIARDQDWHTFELTTPAAVDIQAIHAPGSGRLDVTLFDTSNSVVATGTDRSGDTQVYESLLGAGVYRVRVAPRVSNDYNFYDIRLTVSPADIACTPFEVEFDACEDCGTRSRECDELGNWGAWDECTGEGECTPGTERTMSCAMCGTVASTCDETCTWIDGVCTDQGECEPESVDEQECGDGETQTRVCDESCEWGEPSVCGTAQCVTGDTGSCYSGPISARGIGACVEGTRTCVEGLWGNCDGDVLPATEKCDDAIDNDCDGDTDTEDDSCQESTGELGEACSSDSQCGDGLDCIGSPDYPRFAGGYCGRADCSNTSQCLPDGVCGSAFGQQFCLLVCQDGGDCRPEYVCAGVGGDLACIPRCDRNTQCLDPDLPICDLRNGLCSPIPSADTGPEPVADAPPDAGPPDADVGQEPTPDEPADESDGADRPVSTPLEDQACGCEATPGGSSGWLWALAMSALVWPWPRRRLKKP